MKKIIGIITSIYFASTAFSLNAQIIHHNIYTTVNIDNKSIDVTDSILIPETFLNNNKHNIEFELNSSFSVKTLNHDFQLSEINQAKKDSSASIKTKKYKLSGSPENKRGWLIPLQYSGKVEGEITAAAVDYARGFSETSGIISKDGIYLANSTQWVPSFNDTLFSFNLTTVIDTAWGIISQGTRTENKIVNNKRIVRYEFPDPADEVYLIAAKWTEYNKQAGNILVQAELRTPDLAMANKYLNATIGYLDLYNKLIAPYPYKKFTLVENFWETGYGMPSFTLLGEKIIRFPFIIYTSYPHELLHNYWGNSVYVDNSEGNWCEGATAYMADHLMSEQQGQGAAYRRGTLQKYTDFVNDDNDFPVTKFRSRNNSAEEAIGYGKILMIYEMLRYRFGDDAFKKAFTKFYNDNKFREASFDDIRKSFEAVTTQNLKPFFDQWIHRTGAPTLKLSDVAVNPKNNGYELSFSLSQIQKEDPFSLNVPVVIYIEGSDTVIQKSVVFTSRNEKYAFTFDKRPVQLDIDPGFNVFRRLAKEEEPITLTQIFGDKDVVMILPKHSAYEKEYAELGEKWKQTQNAQGNKLEIVYDEDLQELPDKGTWIVGFENKFAANLNILNAYSDYLGKETMDKTESLKTKGSLVYVFQNTKNKNVTNAFIGGNSKSMVTALSNKVTHYGKYSYLGFEGDAAENKLKGEFPVISSPLSFVIKYDGKTLVSTAKLQPRKALMY